MNIQKFVVALGVVGLLAWSFVIGEEKLKICIETNIPNGIKMGKIRLEYEFGSSCSNSENGNEIILKNHKCEFTSSQADHDAQTSPKENIIFANYTGCEDVAGSGVYAINLGGTLKQVFCEAHNESKYLVIQRRLNGQENFYRNWTEYEEGFGNLTDEFWIGNKALSLITSGTAYKLLIELEAFDSTKVYALYESFSIGGPETKYKLNVAGYSGTAGDSLSGHNGQKFSTFDQDNDNYGGNCAELYKGAWWYSNCHDSNLNGLYYQGGQNPYAEGVNWRSFKGYHGSMKSVVMKIFKSIHK